jgi:putative membrane protein
MMFAWIVIHTIGGHYTFEKVPFDWFNNLFGFERNMYDRVGHFII